MAKKEMEEEMTEEDEEERLEEQQEKIRELAKDAEAEDAAYGYPPEIEKPSAFAFFKKVIDIEDTSKTSFLKKEELGGTRLSVRDYQTLSNFQNFLGNKKVAAYFASKAEIALRTGLSNEGFLLNLAVTQRKERRSTKEKEGKKIWEK